MVKLFYIYILHSRQLDILKKKSLQYYTWNSIMNFVLSSLLLSHGGFPYSHLGSSEAQRAIKKTSDLWIIKKGPWNSWQVCLFEKLLHVLTLLMLRLLSSKAEELRQVSKSVQPCRVLTQAVESTCIKAYWLDNSFEVFVRWLDTPQSSTSQSCKRSCMKNHSHCLFTLFFTYLLCIMDYYSLEWTLHKYRRHRVATVFVYSHWLF